MFRHFTLKFTKKSLAEGKQVLLCKQFQKCVSAELTVDEKLIYDNHLMIYWKFIYTFSFYCISGF